MSSPSPLVIYPGGAIGEAPLVYGRMQDGLGNALLASPFNHLIVTPERPYIQVTFPYFIDTDDDVVTAVTGSGTVTHDGTNRFAVLNTGATANSTAAIETANFIPYRAGQGVICKLVNIFGGGTATSWQEAGIGTAQDGLFWVRNGTTPTIVRRRAGVDVDVIPQGSWNGDTLDGTGASGLTLDQTKGMPLFIAFQWLGFGAMDFIAIAPDRTPILVHRIAYANQYDVASLINPCLPMRVAVRNGAGGGSVTSKVNCLAAFVFGDSVPANRHPFSALASNVAVNTTETFIMALRSLTTFKGVENRVLVQPRNIVISNSGQRVAVRVYRRRRNSTGLTTPTWLPVHANSCMEYALTAGGFTNTGWRMIDTEPIGPDGGIGQVLALPSNELPILPDDYWVITGQSGQSSASTSVAVNLNEER